MGLDAGEIEEKLEKIVDYEISKLQEMFKFTFSMANEIPRLDKYDLTLYLPLYRQISRVYSLIEAYRLINPYVADTLKAGLDPSALSFNSSFELLFTKVSEALTSKRKL